MIEPSTRSCGMALRVQTLGPILFDSVEFLRPPGNTPTKTSEEMQEPPSVNEIRKDVERVIETYLRIEYFGLAAASLDPDSRMTGGVATAPPDRKARLWKSTVGCKLKHLQLSHASALTHAAQLRMDAAELRHHAGRLEALLASPSGRASLGEGGTSKAKALRYVAKGMAACIAKERDRLIRTSRYHEAQILFWHVCSGDEVREYVFEMSMN